MFSSQRRAPADRLAAEPRRRRRDRPRARGKIVWRFAGRRPALRPHGDLARRQAGRGLGLDRRTSSTSSTPRPARRSGSSRPATRRTRTTTPSDGERIYHASIGLVYTPADQPAARHDQGRALLPDRRRRHQRDHRADRHGPEARRGGLSEHELGGAADGAHARREAASTSRSRSSTASSSTTSSGTASPRVADLPIPTSPGRCPREEYLLDSAHHGIAMNGAGRRLCVAGTMSDYAAIVSRSTLRLQALPRRARSPTGRRPAATAALLRLLERRPTRSRSSPTRKRKEIAHIQVGDHPQRIRTGFVRRAWLRSLRSGRLPRSGLDRRADAGTRLGSGIR